MSSDDRFGRRLIPHPASIPGLLRQVARRALRLGLAFVVLGVLATSGGAQAPRETTRQNIEGTPFITNVSPAEFDGAEQNSAIVEDGRGVVYVVAWGGGVLEYDGERWRRLPLPNGVSVQSLSSDVHGRVWYGGAGDIGYLDTGPLGTVAFVSLKGEMPGRYRGDRSWIALGAPDGAYFVADDVALHWDGATMTAWSAETGFQGPAVAEGRLYVRQRGLGLFAMAIGIAEPSLQLVPGGERFAQRDVMSVLPVERDRVLVATPRNGLFVSDSAGVTTFATEADDLLRQGRITSSGAVLPGGRFALGTRAEGLVVIDRQGRLLHHLDRRAGLADQAVRHVSNGGGAHLWLTLNVGLARVELRSPFTRFGTRQGITSKPQGAVRHDGGLYVATMSTGLVRLDAESGAFVRAARTPPTNWALGTVGDDLLVAGGVDGFYTADPTTPVDVSEPIARRTAAVVWASPQDPGTALGGLTDGLVVLRRSREAPSGWAVAGPVPGFDDDVRFIVDAPDGSLWASGQSRLAQVRLPEPEADGTFDLDRVTLSVFGPDDGVPDSFLYLYRVGEEVYATAIGERVFRLDSDANRFVETRIFDAARSGHPFAHLTLEEDDSGRVWIGSTYGAPVVAHPNPDGGGYTFERLHRFQDSRIHEVYPDTDGVVWLGGADELIRYDTRQERRDRHRPLVRAVLVDGVAPDVGRLGAPGERDDVRIPLSSREVRFAYAAPGATGPIRYRTRLDGFDEEWSAWTEEAERAYTNLPAGAYQFRVEAEGRPGQASSGLVVVPPWYRTAWASVLFVVLALVLLAFLVAGIVRALTLRTEVRRRQLERTVADQTRSIQNQNDLLAQQAQKLRQLDAAKGRFFANVSHELRTPLALLLGPIQDLRRGRFTVDPEAKPLLDRADANGRRLQRLVEDLLTLTQADGGALTLRRQRFDLVQFVQDRVSAFGSRPAAAGVVLRFEADVDRLLVDADPNKIETVVYNLVGNALKFTPAGGTVTASVAAEDERARITVADTGIGVEPADLGHLFDRFYQADTEAARVGSGAGIGLALVREIVELHGGTVGAESTLGLGTTVTVWLPLETGALVETDVPIDVPSRPPPVVAPFAAGDGEEGEPPRLGDDGTPLVLVVEDNADLRAYLGTLLGAHYRVEEAVDGAGGLSTAIDLVPDLVVSDVMMPGVDGFTLLAALKGDVRTSHVPVVLLTARADAESRLTGLARGADAYLAKPFDGAELEATVANLLANRRRLREAWGVVDPEAATSDVLTLEPDEAAFLVRIREAVEENLASPAFGAAALAEAVGMSPRQLRRKLGALADETPAQLVRRLRIEAAAVLLAEGGRSVKEVAFETGFASLSGFRSAFRDRYGMAPSAYAERDGAR